MAWYAIYKRNIWFRSMPDLISWYKEELERQRFESLTPEEREYELLQKKIRKQNLMMMLGLTEIMTNQIYVYDKKNR